METRNAKLKPRVFIYDENNMPYFTDTVCIATNETSNGIVTVKWQPHQGGWLASVGGADIYAAHGNEIPALQDRYAALAAAYMRALVIEYTSDHRFGLLLDVSTKHITAADADIIDESDTSNFPVVIYPRDEYGWFLGVPGDDDLNAVMQEFNENFELSDDFMRIMTVASRLKARYIILDRDGLGWPEELFPVNDW